MSDKDYGARWMFALLDYEHWLIVHGEFTLGQLVLNRADRTAVLIPYGSNPAMATLPLTSSYAWWRKWLKTHDLPALP